MTKEMIPRPLLVKARLHLAYEENASLRTRIAALEAQLAETQEKLIEANDKLIRQNEALFRTGAVKVKPLDEDDYEEIISAAAIKMRKATSGARGQIITVQDSLDWWVMKETESRILAALEPAEPTTDEARLREALANLVQEIDDLVSESEGVAGLHLNGDVAEWDDLLPGGPYERLTSLDDARAALKEAEMNAREASRDE